MSEVGRQLVDNERKRKECLVGARRATLKLVELLPKGTDESLAELDVSQAKVAIEELALHRQIMRNLLRELGALRAAAAAEE